MHVYVVPSVTKHHLTFPKKIIDPVWWDVLQLSSAPRSSLCQLLVMKVGSLSTQENVPVHQPESQMDSPRNGWALSRMASYWTPCFSSWCRWVTSDVSKCARGKQTREKWKGASLVLPLRSTSSIPLSQCKWSGTSVFVATATATLSLMVVAETLEL